MDDWESTGGDEANEIYLNAKRVNEIIESERRGSKIMVRIEQYRNMDKGALKAFFTLIIDPQGLKFLDCRYFVSGDKRWFSFPQKEIKYTDGRKSEYIPLVSCQNKDYLEMLKAEVLQRLKECEGGGSNADQGRQVQVPGESSADGERCPF